MNNNGPGLEKVVHTHCSCAEAVGHEGLVLFSASTQSLLVMRFRLSEFQSFFLFINVRYGPNTFTKVWH